jgi:hypothetical protein
MLLLSPLLFPLPLSGEGQGEGHSVAQLPDAPCIRCAIKNRLQPTPDLSGRLYKSFASRTYNPLLTLPLVDAIMLLVTVLMG